MPKFDYIIQNPPYSGTLHIDFFKEGLKHLSNDGQMIIIEPATWLINFRDYGDATSVYPEMKNLINGHVQEVCVEYLNEEFGISGYLPLSITYIDNSKIYNNIKFKLSGYKEIVNALDNCNIVGNTNIIYSIVNKIREKIETSDKHTYSEFVKNNKFDDNLCYIPYPYLMQNLHLVHGKNSNAFKEYTLDSNFINNVHFNYKMYINSYNISENIPKKKSSSGRVTDDNNYYCYVGTKKELENWKHFILINKLPTFLSICFIIDQHNTVQRYLPWLVDKQYTDEEINKLFNFTQEEINLIDYTLEKFERHSPWFKRYMCGPSSVSDEEVQTFIDNLKKNYNVNA